MSFSKIKGLLVGELHNVREDVIDNKSIRSIEQLMVKTSL